jgi:hypothetical protein
MKPRNFDRGNSIGRSDFRDFAELTFDQPTTFDINKYSRELE